MKNNRKREDMDSALKLRMYYDTQTELSDDEIDNLLFESIIVKRITQDWEANNLFNIFRIICLAEIPYIERLKYTQKVITYIKDNVSTDYGFSYTGEVKMIVPCYNALLLEAFVRLGQIESEEVQKALNWIKNYQIFSRNTRTSWTYEGICKHGGCMKATPCYIGIGKTVRALVTYSKYTAHQDQEVESLINQGLAYMLKHSMFQRLSNGCPISAHITDIMFPQAYMLSLTDLVYIANERGLWDKSELTSLKELIEEKSVQENEWKVDYIYGHRGYKFFGSKESSQWLSYLMASDRLFL